MTPNPVIGYLAPNGAAAKAGIQVGDRIVSIGGLEKPTWNDVFMKEFDATNKSLAVTVERQGNRLNFDIPLPEDDRTHMGDAGWDQQREILIAEVTAGEPADRGGLKPGDILKSVNNRPILSLATVAEAVQSSQGAPTEVVYERAGQTGKATVTPIWKKIDPSIPERWAIGIKQDQKMEVTKLSFPDALRESVNRNTEFAGVIYKLLRGMLEQRLSPKSLQGPVGIAREAKRAARQGVLQFFNLMVAVSMNLAIFNLLPIPILDGGVILMLLVEMIRRQDLSLRVKEAVFKAGFAFLMMVVAFVLYNDISRTRADMRSETGTPPGNSKSAPATPAPSK
jgi:regulator of sigma E protease